MLQQRSRWSVGITVALVLAVLAGPFLSGLVTAQAGSDVATTVWPPTGYRDRGTLPDLVRDGLNVTQPRVLGVQPIESYRIEERGQSGARVHVTQEGSEEVSFDLQNARIDRVNRTVQVTSESLNHSVVNVLQGFDPRSVVTQRTFFPPGELNLTLDEEGPPRHETAKAFGRSVELTDETLPGSQVEWRTLSFPTYDTQTHQVFPGTPGCLQTNSGCLENASLELRCNCATVASFIQPKTGKDLTDATDGEIKVHAPGGGVWIWIDKDHEVVTASFSPRFDIVEERLLNPLEARDQLISFLETEPNIEPMNETYRNKNVSSEIHPEKRNSYKEVRLEFNVSLERVEAVGAHYVWTVPLDKVLANDSSRDRIGGGGRVTMDAVTGEVLGTEYRFGPVEEPGGEERAELPVPGLSPAWAAGLVAVAATALARRGRG